MSMVLTKEIFPYRPVLIFFSIGGRTGTEQAGSNSVPAPPPLPSPRFSLAFRPEAYNKLASENLNYFFSGEGLVRGGGEAVERGKQREWLLEILK
jgi:hypothetical protein